MALEKKWIFIPLLSTFLCADHNETNSSNETDIFTSISKFFKKENNNNANSSKINNDINNFNGAWHLRVLDGMEVRKARAILDFTFTDNKAKLSGFDGCNRITGNLNQKPQAQYTAQLISTRMACRGKIQRYVSKRFHETVSEEFSIKKEKKHGIDGITIKSSKHELFFKRMERRSDWF